ncbi:hypothetical protein Pcinc_023993 [Petrolisthes cinctipes]|uniref:Uncharacterized protein n=1 Tax=Petrolisthes cinctipes TaxID=88211 RepID=A0AAE1FCZ6_PETCI|nr:hypothetical protein Pcinc_023993 [Petrolisthes cinctipes]
MRLASSSLEETNRIENGTENESDRTTTPRAGGFESINPRFERFVRLSPEDSITACHRRVAAKRLPARRHLTNEMLMRLSPNLQTWATTQTSGASSFNLVSTSAPLTISDAPHSITDVGAWTAIFIRSPKLACCPTENTTNITTAHNRLPA